MVADRLTRLGLFLLVFAVVALSGPGRIDIVDGDTRYEMARGLLEVGRPVIRDPAIWFNVFPGRDGEMWSTYRFPHAVLGVPVLEIADWLGPPSEGRRRFLFGWIGAGAAGVVAIALHAVFRLRGMAPRAALGWAAAGVVCTPAWYYGTSTFDDILGSALVVAALATAAWARAGRSVGWALGSGLLLAVAMNAKPPLGAFGLAALATAWDPSRPWREQVPAASALLGGAAVGPVAYLAWGWWGYPPGTVIDDSAYTPAFFGDPLVALAALAASAGASALLYCPPVALCLAGARPTLASDRLATAGLLASCGVFVAFVSLLTFFKGDPAWGPRYLTPVFCALWTLAPDGAAVVPRRVTSALLAAGVAVQILALSVDPHRLYVERGLPNMWSAGVPVALFHPGYAHLVQRPREIVDTLFNEADPVAFSPAATPLGAFPMAQHIGTGPHAIREYAVFDTLRPFWIAHWRLPVDDRPVPIAPVALGLVALAAAGAALAARASTPDRRA